MADFEPLPRTEPTTVTGYRAPEDLPSQRVVVDMSDKIVTFLPAATPVLTVTGRIKAKRKTFNKKFEWLDKDIQPRKLTVSGAQTDVDTTIELVAGDDSKLAARYILRNQRTGEIVLASAVGAGSFTAVRGIGGTGIAMNDGDTLSIIGSSYPDNSLMGTMKSINEFPNFGYTQIFRRPFGFSGRDLVTELFGGNDKMTETKWQAIEHKRDIEFSFIYGKRHLIPAAGGVKDTTFTQGLINAVQTNVWNVGGVQLNKRTFDEMLEEGLRWGKGGRLQAGAALKYLLAPSRWMTEINGFVDNQLEYRVMDSEIGFSAMEYKSPHGRVRLIPSPVLDENTPDTAILVDFNHLEYAYLRQRDTRLMDNREENDRDGEAYEFLSDCGLLVEFEQSHVVLKGLSV